MKWKKGTAGRSNGKKKSGSSSKSKSSPGYKDSNSASGDEPSSTPTTPMDSAGALRVGIIRSNTAPFCTPTPRAKRQLISDLLEPTDVEEEDEDLKSVSASHSLRSIISNRSSLGRNFDKEVGTGGSFSSYCAEEKVRIRCHLVHVPHTVHSPVALLYRLRGAKEGSACWCTTLFRDHNLMFE